MARIRTIKPEISEDEKLGSVSRDARLTFILLWTICDDHGRFRAAPIYVRNRLFGYDEDTAIGDVARWLRELADIGTVVIYKVDGEQYGVVTNWEKHQRIDNASKPLYPEPPQGPQPPDNPAETRRSSPQSAENDSSANYCTEGDDSGANGDGPQSSAVLGESPQASASDGDTPLDLDLDLDLDQERTSRGNERSGLKLVPPEPPSPPAPDLSFEEDFWLAYPRRDGRRQGKKPAREKWAKLSKADREAVVKAVPNYAAHCERTGTYARDPVRFLTLKDRFWEEWLEPAAPAPPPDRPGASPQLSPDVAAPHEDRTVHPSAFGIEIVGEEAAGGQGAESA